MLKFFLVFHYGRGDRGDWDGNVGRGGGGGSRGSMGGSIETPLGMRMVEAGAMALLVLWSIETRLSLCGYGKSPDWCRSLSSEITWPLGGTN